MPYEIRPITGEEFAAFMGTEGAAFGQQPTEQELSSRREAFELDRSLAAFDGTRVVATAAALSFELTLPGNVVIPVPGVSWVSVAPTNRRQGILTALMRRQLNDIREHGEALAMLNASESAIYGRFGYGLASSTLHMTLEKRFARLMYGPEPTGRVRLIEHEQALEVMPVLYDRLRRTLPGALNRPPYYWGWFLADPTKTTDGFGPRFYAVYEAANGRIEGATHYRVKSQWDEGLANGTLLIREVFAETTEARAGLWSFLLGIDLIGTVRMLSRPVDEPLRWMLADPRRLRVTALNDDLWVRLLDIPRALASRRYATPGRLIVEVADAFLPENAGRYLLEGQPEGATCTRTAAEPDLSLGVAELGAAFLGGVRFGTLARAGRVTPHTPHALARADALFTSDPLPYSGTPF